MKLFKSLAVACLILAAVMLTGFQSAPPPVNPGFVQYAAGGVSNANKLIVEYNLPFSGMNECQIVMATSSVSQSGITSNYGDFWRSSTQVHDTATGQYQAVYYAESSFLDEQPTLTLDLSSTGTAQMFITEYSLLGSCSPALTNNWALDNQQTSTPSMISPNITGLASGVTGIGFAYTKNGTFGSFGSTGTGAKSRALSSHIAFGDATESGGSIQFTGKDSRTSDPYDYWTIVF